MYTDGSCLGNPGPGGWAWACEAGWHSNGELRTTNNAMELQAILQALKAAHSFGAASIIVRTDSQYSIDVATKWIFGWKKRQWMTAAGTPVANRAVIEEIFDMGSLMKVSYEKVKAHSGHEWNEKVDDLARRQATAWRDGRGRLAGPGFTS